jgi:hypothetical protein
MGDLAPFKSDLSLFANLIAFDGVQASHQGSSPFDPASTSPTETSSNSFQVAEKDQHNGQLTTYPKASTLAADDLECTPVPEHTTGDGGQPLDGKKRRRSRTSPEQDYSEIMVELNKKRKRTGQACDRCKVCYLQHRYFRRLCWHILSSRCTNDMITMQIRRFKCDPGRTGCLGCLDAGLDCKVTDRVTGETYVRGAAGLMAAEIEALNAHVTALQEENSALKRETEPRSDLQTTNTIPTPDFLAAMASLQNQQRVQHQQIVSLQQDNEKLRQKDRMHREDKRALKQLVEEQEDLLRLTEVGLLFVLLVSKNLLTRLTRTCHCSTRRSIGSSRSGQHPTLSTQLDLDHGLQFICQSYKVLELSFIGRDPPLRALFKFLSSREFWVEQGSFSLASLIGIDLLVLVVSKLLRTYCLFQSLQRSQPLFNPIYLACVSYRPLIGYHQSSRG